MKVIELLNKVANGEEVPKKIKYCNQVFELTENKVDWYCYDYAINFLGNEIGIFDLNDEVEIIEEPQEHKIPEKLDKYADVSGDLAYDWSIAEKKLKDKINEILDYLEEL